MISEVVAQIEAEAHELRGSDLLPDGFEDELDAVFEQAAELALGTPAGTTTVQPGLPAAAAGLVSRAELAQLRRRATRILRRALGPSLRRVERRGLLEAARLGESAWLQVHVTVDHLERVAASSTVASRVLFALRPRELGGSGAQVGQPTVEGPLLGWVIGRFSTEEPPRFGGLPRVVLHTECGDGRIVEALAARGIDARGADPGLSARSGGETNIVAAGALEYLGATPSGTLDGLLLTGVVDRLRPGAARALAHLAARCLAPGGVVVIVSARPEAAVALDPVAADLSPGRPLHPVTWCHLLARFGLEELEVFDDDTVGPGPGGFGATEAEAFAVSARRRATSLMPTDGGPS